MKILYDHQMFSLQKYGGISKYFCELMKRYPDSHSYILSLLFSNNQHLKDDVTFFNKINVPLPKNESRVKGHLKRNFYKINNLYSKYVISSNHYDLLHPTYFDPYFLPHVKKPYIVTVHDLVVFKFNDLPRKQFETERMTKIIKGANRIISISENTKKDLIEILKINPEKIDVIYHGYNKYDLKDNINCYGRYILYVGVRLGYKNFSTLAKAFKKLIIQDTDLKLICVGPSFSKEESKELARLKIDSNTLSVEVNENKLNQLYSNALAFVYPTKHEGFGMPILEAFANNCPVCLSNTSCLPEIAGDAGNYFDPNVAESIYDTIKKVIYDANLSQNMIQKGNDRLKIFSWVKCTERTIMAYEKAIS